MKKKKKNEDAFPGYPAYPSDEDVYSKLEEKENIDPEDVSKTKKPNKSKFGKNEKDFEQDVSGSDLDIPGSEDDEDTDNMGIDDEENSFYSLGGDDHENLDEDIEEV